MRFLLERIFFIAVTSSLIIGGLFIFPQYGEGYDDQTTHPALTDEIVDFYNLSFGNKLTDEEKEWIVEGSIKEDTPPRWINHFYDPTTGEGWKSENLGDVPPITLKIFSKIFLNATTETVSSKNWVHNELLQAKYADYGGNRTWENAIRRYVNGDREYAYRTLGDVLHLLEDKAVPDHTRNDTHAHEGSLATGDGGSPYEDYGSNYTRGNLVIAQDLKKENKSPIIFGSLDEYFDYLAEYSNKYFFSEHTITSGKYEYPKILREGNGYAYGRDQYQNETILSEVRVEINSDLRTTKIYTLNNEQVLSSYFSLLSREAVLSGAGVINLFHEEVTKAEKDKNLIKEEPTISWWQKMRSPGYGVIIPMINVTVNGVARVYNTSITVINKVADVTTFILSRTPTSQDASLLDAVTRETQNTTLAQPPTQDPILDKEDTANASTTRETTQTIQKVPLDSGPVVEINQPITQPLVSVGGAVPIVAASAPVSALAPVVQTATSEEQNTEQATTTDTAATTTPPIDTTPTDTTPPVITILGEDPAIIYTGDRYADAGAIAQDEVDGLRTVSTSSNVNTFTAGSYTVTYTATDLAGNIGTTIRTVNVLDAVVTLSYSDLNGNGTADSEEGEVIVSSNASLPAGEYRFSNLAITASSTLTLMSNFTASTTFKGVKITARNITVDFGSSISTDMQGYDQSISGPGAASYPGGASYGGIGYGNTAASVYGSALTPIDLGSSGPSVCCSVNKNGGGAIRLVVAGILTNNGNISADGSSPSTSGGSIYVTTNNLVGTGSFHANGGSGSSYHYTGAGGGGRIAVYYQISSYTGTAEALGGLHSDGWGSSRRVGDGTAALFDMTNNNLSVRAPWQFRASDGPFNFNHITLEDGAIVSIESGAQVTAHELSLSGAASLSIGGGAVVTIPLISIDGQSSLVFPGGAPFMVDTLSIMGTSTILVAQGAPLALLARNITLSADSSINVDGRGYSPASGPGKSLNPFGGASYGGVGASNTATSTYGSAFVPTDMGSGGNGGNSAYGGGAVKLIASDTLTINGTISANGGETASGGSIYLVAPTITGSGSLRAEGGGPSWQGQYIEPGAGGRIALDSLNQIFSGSMSAAGRCRWSSGFLVACAEDGTVAYGASITSFELPALSPAVTGTIDERAHTIELAVPYGTDVAALVPTITVSRGATVAPISGEAQDFANPVTYTVTSATSSTQTYIATVTVDPAPLDTTPPVIESYTLNGVGESVTTASTTMAVVLSMTASEDVDWVSIKIENESNPGNYKVFYSGTGCVDNTNTCEKTWDGTLSHGELTDGIYRIKVRMKDAVDNEFLEYLSPYTITVTQPVMPEITP